MRPIADRGAFGLTNTIVTIPKADLLASTPSIANTTKFENNSIGATGFTVQPAVDLNNGPLPAVFLSSPLVTAGIRSSGDPTSSAIFDRQSWTPPAWFQSRLLVPNSLPTSQHSSKVWKSSTGASCTPTSSYKRTRFGECKPSSLIVVPLCAGFKLIWSVTWFQEGLITQSGLDFYYGSIAVNEFSDVVIGFSGSGTSQFVSSYAEWARP